MADRNTNVSSQESDAGGRSPSRHYLEYDPSTTIEGDSGLTLMKKGSWFGSTRHAMLNYARAYVGSWRSVRIKPNTSEKSTRCDGEGETETRINTLPAAISSSSPNRHRNVTSKTTIMSIGRRLYHHEEKHKPLHQFHSAPPTSRSTSSSQDRIADHCSSRVGKSPVQLVDAPPNSTSLKPLAKHVKNSSLGRSIVGSLRSLRRPTAKNLSLPWSHGQELEASAGQAAILPLRYSSADFSPPPILDLDLGPAALIPTALHHRLSMAGGVVEDIDSTAENETRVSEIAYSDHLDLHDEAKDNLDGEKLERLREMPSRNPGRSILPSEEHTAPKFLQESSRDEELADRTSTTDLLQDKRGHSQSADEVLLGASATSDLMARMHNSTSLKSFSRGSRNKLESQISLHDSANDPRSDNCLDMSIPIPQHGAPLASHCINDSTEVFERSVEYKDKAYKKEARTLKKMASLDAVAAECAVRSADGLENMSKHFCQSYIVEPTHRSHQLETSDVEASAKLSVRRDHGDPFPPRERFEDLAIVVDTDNEALKIGKKTPEVNRGVMRLDEPCNLDRRANSMIASGAKDLGRNEDRDPSLPAADYSNCSVGSDLIYNKGFHSLRNEIIVDPAYSTGLSLRVESPLCDASADEYCSFATPKQEFDSKDVRHSIKDADSDNVELELEDLLAQHYIFRNAIDEQKSEDVDLTGDGPPTEDFHQRPMRNSSSSYSSPGTEDNMISSSSRDLLLRAQQNSFDALPGDSPTSQHCREYQMVSHDNIEVKNQGEANPSAFVFGIRESVIEAPQQHEDTLDECLEMFQHFNLSQEMLGKAKEKESEASYLCSVAEHDSRWTSPTSKRSIPARYRSARAKA